ncbi:creatininase family protein [Actinocrispum wychmicini]|uniref:Creatinine amidohydrolase n=1 Tax=Actinocrispum wychmicini TaxID=1213861 RepID=A0A4R2ITH4_9PSEU|nr:creatininase family protein [Actinocrispum wychmicini]TCO48791.1 creatinine amidohydrolase [Actinocrispum wychmicini]
MNGLLPLDTSVDVRDRAVQVAVLPVGSFEQHGAFLPLITDTAIATTITRAVADAYPLLHLPPVTISCSHEHAAWPGTVSISATTLYAIVKDIQASLARSGVHHLVVVNGHGGNYVLSNVVQESERMGLFPTEVDWNTARFEGGIETPVDSDMHAGELETSILLHAHPELVRADYADHDHLADDRRHMLTLGLNAYTTTGVVGEPSLATAEKGQYVLASLVKSFGQLLDVLKPSS